MPDIGDYDQSMRDARLCLVPPHLKAGKVFQEQKRGPKGEYTVVWAKSGTFAVFYRLDLPNGSRKGIRCFLTRVGDETKQRYAVLAKLLPRCLAARTVRFQFHERGIRVAGKEYPIVEMDFADGRTLVEEVEELCKANERAALASLAQKWRVLMTRMETVQMAHGDLSGENVIVRSSGMDRELVLIDYDGIFLPNPVLRKYPSSEVGNPNYQHRETVATSRRKYDERMDDFSGLAIYVALLAFSERPQLFKQFGSTIDGRLLYSQADFANPDKSAVFRELRRCSGEELRCLVDELAKACVGKVVDIKRLGWLFENWPQLPVPPPTLLLPPRRPQRQKRIWPIIAGCLLISLFCIADYAVVPVMYVVKPTEWSFLWVPVLYGTILAQGGLISAGLVFSPGSFWLRTVCCWTVSLFFLCCWVNGFLAIDASNHSANWPADLQRTGFSLPLIALAIQAPLWLARGFWGWRLARFNSIGTAAQSFSIRDYLSGIAIAATSISCAQLVRPSNLDTSRFWLVWAIILGWGAAASLLGVIPAMLAVFHVRDWRIGFFLLLLYGLIAGVVTVAILSAVMTTPEHPLEIAGTGIIFFSLAAFLGGGMVAARGFGLTLLFGWTR